jgi:hypothetical protein
MRSSDSKSYVMTSRRDFLKGFAALASGLVLAPASALANVTRLGPPAAWIPAAHKTFALGFMITREFVEDARAYDIVKHAPYNFTYDSYGVTLEQHKELFHRYAVLDKSPAKG